MNLLVYGGHYNTSDFSNMAMTCICLLQSKSDVIATFFIAMLALAAVCAAGGKSCVSDQTIRMCVVVLDSG